MIANNAAQRIAHYLTVLPGEQVKAAMLAWTASADVSITALEQALAEKQDAIALVDALAKPDTFSTVFPSMTEAEMIKASLQSLAEYQRTGAGITQDEMEEWAATLANDKRSA